MRLADYRLVGLTILLTVVWLLTRTKAWRTLLRGRATFSQVFWTVNEGYLLNNLLPFRLGEIGRAFLLSRKAAIGFLEVFSSIIIERILDLGFAAGLVLVTLPLVVGADWALEAAILVSGIVITGFLFLYLLARNREWALEKYASLCDLIPVFRKLGGERVAAFFDGLAILTEGRQFISALLWLALNWAIGILQYYVLLKAFFSNGELLWAAFTLGVVALGIAAPSSPGGIGVFELAVVGALSLFGLEPSTSLAYAISLHLIQFLVTGVLGAFGFLRDGESLIGIYQKSRQIPQTPS